LLGAPNSQLTLGWSSDIMGTRKKKDDAPVGGL